MSKDLTRAQQILMWELFATGGAKIQMAFLPKLDGKDRDELAKRKLIRLSPAGRSQLLELEDSGWQWIADSEPFPIAEGEKRVTAERRLLQSLIGGFKRFAGEQDKTIQTLFRSLPLKEDKKSKSSNASKKNGSPKRAVINEAPVEQRIHDAFFKIAGKPAKGNIRLSQLRSSLQDIERSDVDATLVAMWKAGRINLSNLDNPRDVAAETEAALKSGANTFHVVRINE